MSLGDRIKVARLTKGLTQPKLAELFGVSKGSIGNYETDTSSPKDKKKQEQERRRAAAAEAARLAKSRLRWLMAIVGSGLFALALAITDFANYRPEGGVVILVLGTIVVGLMVWKKSVVFWALTDEKAQKGMINEFNRHWGSYIAAVAVYLAILAVVLSAVEPAYIKPASNYVPAQSTVQSTTAKKTTTTTTTTTTTRQLTAQEQMEQYVNAAITKAGSDKVKIDVDNMYNEDGEPDGNVKVEIYLAVRDNWNTKYIRLGMYLEAKEILEQLQQHKNIVFVCFFWSTDLVDSYGNSSNENVMKLLFNADTIAKINFDNFSTDNVPIVADDYYIHPALKD